MYINTEIERFLMFFCYLCTMVKKLNIKLKFKKCIKIKCKFIKILILKTNTKS